MTKKEKENNEEVNKWNIIYHNEDILVAVPDKGNSASKKVDEEE